MKLTGKLIILSFALSICLLVTSAQSAENNSYRAGYVVGYQEQESAKANDSTLTYGRYAVQKRELLKEKGHVPMNFVRGLKDGFRDSVRNYKPKFTIEKVDLEQLPLYLHPTP